VPAGLSLLVWRGDFFPVNWPLRVYSRRQVVAIRVDEMAVLEEE
jgi:hypothetical protein